MQRVKPEWTILSNHGIVLFHIAANPNSTVRQLSDNLGLSERWIAQIVKDLAASDMIRIERRGQHNYYEVNADAHFRHPTLSHIALRQIIAAVVPRIGQKGQEPAKENTTPHFLSTE
jgi:DNA-binding IscR family transcriptional regulator